ncbi:MAG: TonB-dependent receptor [Bacteroidota bacterium]|nr:TonB-dependent receptor [Bacteroidota bacterium]
MRDMFSLIGRPVCCKAFITAVAALLLPFLSFSQKYTISGYVSDAETGENLIGAVVYDMRSDEGIMTNSYGFFSLTLPSDSVLLAFSYIGYEQVYLNFRLTQDTLIKMKLQNTSTSDVVTITGEKTNVDNTQMSTISIPIEQIKNAPALFGEVDVLRTLQLLPGIKGGSEGTTGIYVRGGGPDQNLILLDGVPVYNASHLFGFFSVFNADALSTVDMIKGGYPARYGGRLSSVLDIRMKEGNKQTWTAEGSIGLISSKLTVEGPLVKDRSSFILSGRRTYIDLLAKPFVALAGNSANGEKVTAGYYFYDLNAKLNHRVGDKDHFYLSLYTGDDKAYATYSMDNQFERMTTDFGLGWGNLTGALRWNHLISPRLFSNTTIAYSRFLFDIDTKLGFHNKDNNTTEEFQYRYFSGIHDWSGRVDFDYIPSPKHYLKFGVHGIYHTFSPGAIAFKVAIGGNELDTSFGQKNIYGTELATYVEDDITLTPRLKANIGLHASGFFVKDEFYRSLQPRISTRYLVNPKWSIKASYAEMMQYIHLLSNAGIGLPTDLWVPATDRIPPQTSRQIAAGVAHSFKEEYEVSLEGYYKTMNNIIEYKDGASYIGPEVDWQDIVEIGKGNAYGMEFLVQKKSGRTNGWIGYTLSWTNRQFENVNFGKAFPYRFDRRHDIGVVVSHKFTDRIDAAMTFVYGTGNAVTLPVLRYRGFVEGGSRFPFPGQEEFNTVNYVEGRNGFRMAATHRMDIGINFHKAKKWGTRTWSVGAYNVYSRQNPFFYFFANDNQGNPQLKQMALFPIIPSVSYKFKINNLNSLKFW